MYGYDKNELERQANRFAEKLLIHPRIQTVNTDANINWWEKDLYQYDMTLQADAMAQQHRSFLDIIPSLNTFNRTSASSFLISGGKMGRLVNDDLLNNDMWLLQNKNLNITDSTALSFKDIGTLEKKKVSNSLHKENQQYIRVIEFEYTGSAQFGKKYLQQCMAEMKLEMPLGYMMEEITWSFGHESRTLYGLVLLVIVLVFMICSIHFESLRQAIAIILLIPVSFIGIF